MAPKEPTYSDADIASKLQSLPGWYCEDGWIRRIYKTEGWPGTLMLVNAIAYVALDEGVTVLTNLVDCDFDRLRIGDPVRAVFKPQGELVIPMFTPA